MGKALLYDKESIINSRKYKRYVPELTILLKDGVNYTISEIDKMLQKLLKMKG